ncbi:MAG: hypothetical protein COB50_03560, partial [Thiotrichales bacterium]
TAVLNDVDSKMQKLTTLLEKHKAKGNARTSIASHVTEKSAPLVQSFQQMRRDSVTNLSRVNARNAMIKRRRKNKARGRRL